MDYRISYIQIFWLNNYQNKFYKNKARNTQSKFIYFISCFMVIGYWVARFEGFTAMKIHAEVFWVVTPRSVSKDLSACRWRQQGIRNGVTTPKTST